MNKTRSNLIWIDLEMTGLNPEVDAILEIATIVTDSELTILEEGPTFVIHQPESVLDIMDPWVRDLHAKTGLTDEVRASTIPLYEAEHDTLSFIQQHCPPKKGILCGNSVWQDAAFMRRTMPRIINYLHYRIIDVSSVKEILARWYPGNPHLNFKKSDGHRALVDIFASIEELRHYRKYFFISS